MIARPCINCGHPIAAGTHCTGCRPASAPRDITSVHWNTGRWKNLSTRLRKESPFCELCNSTSYLQVDHLLPITDYPELTYEVENLRVLCRLCNGTRGATYTHDDAHRVLTALLRAQAHRPKAKHRQLIPIAQRAVDQGEHPARTPVPPGDKARGPLHTTIVVSRTL